MVENGGELTTGFAEVADAGAIAGVLAEAAAWMRERGAPPWLEQDTGPSFIAARTAAGEMVAARRSGEVVGVCTLTRADPAFWPEDQPGEAAYLHRLAVPRAEAGGRVTPILIAFCAETARSWSCRALKLDCHPQISHVYHRLGFTPVDRFTVRLGDRPPFVVQRFAMLL